jgi:hypothetical protein
MRKSNSSYRSGMRLDLLARVAWSADFLGAVKACEFLCDLLRLSSPRRSELDETETTETAEVGQYLIKAGDLVKWRSAGP